ncbi:hypothetical protein SESBI_25289 [Sesbania bispinosa]|nr:hypothetical protein SESBI_25289 [Sesbania bispinosa]
MRKEKECNSSCRHSERSAFHAPRPLRCASLHLRCKSLCPRREASSLHTPCRPRRSISSCAHVLCDDAATS